MKKILNFGIIASFMSSAPIVLANVVIVDSYVILNAASEGATFAGQNYYDVKRDSGPVNPNFGGSLGTFNISSSSAIVGGVTYSANSILQLKGAEIKTESTGGDYQNANNFARMLYAITPSSEIPTSTSFTQFNLSYQGEQPYPINKWDTTGVTFNLLSGLTENGTYRLTVYFESNGSWFGDPDGAGPLVGQQNFFNIAPDNNGGTNYSATFNVIPEPASSLLMGLGLAGLLALRKNRKA